MLPNYFYAGRTESPFGGYLFDWLPATRVHRFGAGRHCWYFTVRWLWWSVSVGVEPSDWRRVRPRCDFCDCELRGECAEVGVCGDCGH